MKSFTENWIFIGIGVVSLTIVGLAVFSISGSQQPKEDSNGQLTLPLTCLRAFTHRQEGARQSHCEKRDGFATLVKTHPNLFLGQIRATWIIAPSAPSGLVQFNPHHPLLAKGPGKGPSAQGSPCHAVRSFRDSHSA